MLIYFLIIVSCSCSCFYFFVLEKKKQTQITKIEIKLDKSIDSNIIRIAIEKIKRFNPERYYVLSYIGTKESDKTEIADLITEIKMEHGCQIIINGVIPTLKYYLRLITSLDEFIENYNEAIEIDTVKKFINNKDRLSNSLKKSKEIFSLPLYPELSIRDIKHICKTLKRVVSNI